MVMLIKKRSSYIQVTKSNAKADQKIRRISLVRVKEHVKKSNINCSSRNIWFQTQYDQEKHIQTQY